MTERLSRPCTAFDGTRLLSSGLLIEVALAVKTALDADGTRSILVFDDISGQVIDLDLRGTKADVIAALMRPQPAEAARVRPGLTQQDTAADATAGEPRGRGRPKLGVIGREVTLLPRHWDWLAQQPGGASVALRKLVDEARRTGGARQRTRLAQEAAYRFMSAMAGDLPRFEEAARALFADDRARFEQQIADWPEAVSAYANRLAYGPRPVEVGSAGE